MSSWANATITNKGYALQGKLLSTDKLTITRIVSASGKVPAGQLVNQTDVTDIKQTITLEALSYNEDGAAVIKVSLNNTDLSEGYTCTQIGIFASDPDEGEILYAISQSDDSGEGVPSITEQPAGFYCGWIFIIGFGGASGISVTIDPANAITQESGDVRYLKQADVNIRKNSKDGAGDIVEGHFTVGSRASESTYGKNSFSSGETATASGKNAFVAGGSYNTVSGNDSFASGRYNTASGIQSFVGGGHCNSALGDYGSFVAGGSYNTASGARSFVAGGDNNTASGASSLAGGICNVANDRQTVFGKYADTSSSTKGGVTGNSSTVGSLFTIGNGTTESSRSNAFRVSAGGAAYVGQGSHATGADYAEYMEWEDGNPNNEDRRGRMVTFALTEATCTVEEITILHPVTRLPVQVKAITSNKFPPVRFAKAGDNVIGVVSGSGAFIGNTASEIWDNQYLKDVYGERIQQAVFVPEETKVVTNPKTGEVIGEEVIPEHYETRFVLNPLYDSEQEYISREERPEWSPIGLLGMVTVEDDGSCVVGSFCKPSTNGIGTSAESGYRVIQRIDDTHIKVFVK